MLAGTGPHALPSSQVSVSQHDASRQVFRSVAGLAALGTGGAAWVAPRTRAAPVATASVPDGWWAGVPAPALGLFGAAL